MSTISRRTVRTTLSAVVAGMLLLTAAMARPAWSQEECFATAPGECKNEWLVNAYGRTCEVTTSACEHVTEFLSDACQSACTFGQQAWDALCGVTYAACSDAHDACESLASGAYQTCLTTGLGTDCNTEHVACKATCTAAILLAEGHGECWRPFSDACKSAKAACGSTCDSTYGTCKRDRCDALWGSVDDVLCGECNDCEGTLDLECNRCTEVARGDCLAASCGPAADALCIQEKQLGEACVWGECAWGLRCFPSLTGLEDLAPAEVVAGLLGATSPQEAIDALMAAGSNATAHNVRFANLFCTDLDKGCHCSLPLLDNVGKELDTAACLALYRPGRHFSSYLLNNAIDATRDLLVQRWRDAAGSDPVRGALIDEFESSDRLQTVALAYGVGGQAAAVAGGTAEVGTLYGPRCYGCYYTVCGSAVSDLTVNAYGTVGVYDAGGLDIENLQGLSRVVSLAASTPELEVGGGVGLVFPIPLQVQFGLDDIGGAAWNQQLEDWGTQVESLVENPEDVLEWFIPGGATGAVSVGVGVLPANVAGSLCYTRVRESLCLREDGGDASCPAIEVGEAVIDLPVAACRDQVVAASAWPACQGNVSIDAGSTGYETLTQLPAPPYDIGVRNVTLTAYNARGALSSCTGDISVTDETPPQITCPWNPAPVECGANGRGVVDPGDAVATDCTDVTLTDTRASSYPLGQTDVFYRATDVAGNVGGPCTTTVTVADTMAPSITCPGDLAGRCAVERSFAVITSDVCDPSPSVSCVDPGGQPVDPQGHVFPVGDTTVQCTATDSAGNTQQCTFTATIADSIACRIDRLIATVRAEPELDPFEVRMLARLDAAAALADRVDALLAEGRTQQATRVLRAVGSKVRSFGRLLREHEGRRSISEALRQVLLAEEQGIRDEVRTLRRTLRTSL